ncbi:MAG: HAD-IB family hydrolase [Ilumatobacter sp.]|uniref:HAD family hydrolase n=1 Tax=Ilumatobacter sp. TaxID=1967498 RepID=UPI00262EACE6|nr:HAD-IB family hydrolase [Ilumatobacter sp.]MDJ0768836.1 HAD-IB family hydrolase [Ilumatobacter sp.]
MSEYVSVATGGPSAAFFDLDRTLIAGSSAFTLATAARSMKMMPAHELVRDALTAATFKFVGDHSGDGTSDAVRDRILGFVKGQRQDDLQALNERVLPRLLGKIRPEARRLVDIHRHAGRATFIVSAAPQEIVEPLAISLGMTGGIGTRGKVADGVYTGELDGPFCYAQGKVDAIEHLARWDGLDLRQCYAYSDSSSDLPMLGAVGHPVAVNPDSKLERHARLHAWPVVIFSQRTKTVIRRTVAGVASAGLAAGTFAAGIEVGTRRARRGWFR